MYGRKKLSDKKLKNILADLETNNGRFSFSSIYTKHPSAYKSAKAYDKDWENLVNTIGGLGRAYAISKTYGKNSDSPKSKERLKRAIYKSNYCLY